MEEAILGFWKGMVELGMRPLLALGLQEEQPMLLCGRCGWLMPLLDHMRPQNCEGVASHVGFMSINFVLLVRVLCVQQF
jgi:hypothetical protein